MSNGKKRLKYIVNMIKNTAIELGIHPTEVTVKDIAEFTDISEWELRKFGGLGLLKKSFPITDNELTAIKQQKDSASYIVSLEKKLVEKINYQDLIKSIASKTQTLQIKPFKSKKKTPIKRQLNLILSDLHIGSDISKGQTGQLDFGKIEEARRLGYIIKEVIDYKKEHRNNTKLNVLLLGDLIQHSLHDARDGAPLAEQSARAIYLLNQAIALLSSSFPEVEVHCNTGNHGRNTARHHNRAVNQKWDSIETIINYAVKESCRHLKNVKFNLPLTPYIEYEVFGKKIFATHGDTVLNPGYPGKGIKTGVLENQINKINASLNDADEYSVFIVGHVHVASVTHLSNGATMVTNGAMVPADEYAVSIGMMESSNGQYIFESVTGHPFGDSRLIKVTEVQDKDKSLDEVIKPWESL